MVHELAQESRASQNINPSLFPLQFGVSLSTHFLNKQPLTPTAYTTFTASTLTVFQLAAHLSAGHAICTGILDRPHRASAHVTSVQVIGIDFDTLSCEQALRHPLVNQHAAIVYATASSTPATPRSRALWVLSAPVDVHTFRVYMKRLLRAFGAHADNACSDPARIWFGSTQTDYCVRSHFTPPSVFDALPDPTPPSIPTLHAVHTIPTTSTLQSVYRNASTHSRNAGLFAASLYARDSGVSLPVCARALVDGFVNDAPRTPAHAPQTAAARHREALQTIASAYSHPPRTADTQRTENGHGLLPNVIRERLMGLKLTSAARVLEILSTVYVAGDIVRCADAVRLCAGFHVSNKTVRSVLEASVRSVDTDTGEIEDARIFTPFCAPHVNALSTAATTTPAGRHADDRVKTGVKINHNTSTRGRKSKLYVMPSVEELARILHIDLHTRAAHHSDALPITAYASAQAYRIAMHAAFIERNPGVPYSRTLLAGRLGVSKRTLAYYDRRLGVQKQARTTDMLITWQNARHLLTDDAHGNRWGAWLTDGATRKPPRLGIARSMLARGTPVWLCVQGTSARWMPVNGG